MSRALTGSRHEIWRGRNGEDQMSLVKQSIYFYRLVDPEYALGYRLKFSAANKSREQMRDTIYSKFVYKFTIAKQCIINFH